MNEDNIIKFPGYLRTTDGNIYHAATVYQHAQDMIDAMSDQDLCRTTAWELRRWPKLAKQYYAGNGAA
jgi:hypothetical protein